MKKLNPIGSLFGDTWKMYRERFSVLVEILLLPVLIVALGYVLIVMSPFLAALGGLVLLAGWIVFILATLALMISISEKAGVDASYKTTMSLFWPFLWIIVLNVLAVIGGFFMLGIPGIWLSIALGFAGYIFVIEKRRGIDALRQSKDYLKGYWWAFFGRSLLIGLIFVGASIVIRIPVALLTLGLGKATILAIQQVISAGLILFYTPFSLIFHYLVFRNLQELKPELVGTETKEGTTFIKVSAIVGLVAPFIFALLLVALVGIGIFAAFHQGTLQINNGPANYYYPAAQPGYPPLGK